MAHGKKTGGRTVGTPNKITGNLKSRIATLMDERFDNIAYDLQILEPKDRIAAYLKLMEYVVPKQREQKIDMSTLSDEQIDDLLEKALTKVGERSESY
ncbi:hypothetical protein [Fibrivirga algicola]|uniref:Uncharacterized protein n=1 Tax=Fibrivirga algicola TaxID=2950420 RepID=A0ABX0QK80_9BACT|nr:hypothetical protein [Fibrivirga algicola]NID11550.1 hypothetical protein [Fibrivirga algicola]